MGQSPWKRSSEWFLRADIQTLQHPPGSGADATGAGGKAHQSEEEKEATTRQV